MGPGVDQLQGGCLKFKINFSEGTNCKLYGVGTAGIIMNLATILAGAATNPFNSGYFQGDVLAPLEAVTACPAIFGPRAYPGYPGDLRVDKISRASYNAYGVNGRKFLFPAIWDPVQTNCKVVA
ncbi:protein EXORDIUM-like 2 [Camellia sinensis]|uniref:protein EXORDIUM-like 2 n=1 Tax=Camellia sinensis TaxID=4442 RepID=UPI0010369F50|nr:protein EXORDIUM-like 2 [Camellia sinensis]